MSCSSKCSVKFASLLFALIAVAHLLRVVFGWTLVFNDAVVPMWPSIIFVVVGSAMSLCLCRAACCGSGCCKCGCCKKEGDKQVCCDKPAATPAG